MTWSIYRLYSLICSSTSRIHIWVRTNVCSIGVTYLHISSEIFGFSIATQRIWIRSQIRHSEITERITLHSVPIDHAVVWSELKYFIGAQNLNWKQLVFSGKTSPCPVVQVLRGMRAVATVRFSVEPDLNLIREFGPCANTTVRSIFGVSYNYRCTTLITFDWITVHSHYSADISYFSSSCRDVLSRNSWWQRWSFSQWKYKCTIM